MITTKYLNDYIEDIEVTDIDTFAITVTIKSDEEIHTEGLKLQFQIARHERTDPIISKQFNAVEGYFSVYLTSEEKALLPQGNYAYRLTLIDDNNIITTTKGGKFTVKWGA